MQEVNQELAIKHGLTADEYNKIIKLMGRNPNLVELGIFSAMWNEHCSYKSSRIWLQTLPTKNKYVIQDGPYIGMRVVTNDANTDMKPAPTGAVPAATEKK